MVKNKLNFSEAFTYDVRKSPVRGLVGVSVTPLFSTDISEFLGLTTCVILEIPASFLKRLTVLLMACV